MKILQGLSKAFDFSKVAAATTGRALHSSGKFIIDNASDLSSRIGKAVGSKYKGVLARRALKKMNAEYKTARAGGKADVGMLLETDLNKQVNAIERLAKSTDQEADATAEAAKAASAADAAKPGAKPGAEAGETAEAAEAAKNKKKKQVRYMRIVGVLLAIAAASATAAVVMDMYADRAKKEREVCLSRWETTYLSIIKDANGELLEIDSAEKWSDNLIYLEQVIEARPEVNYDPEKANALLVEMYNGLAECIEIDDSPIGSFLRGVTADVGSAFGNLVDPIVAPVNKIIASSTDFVMYIGIAVGAFAGFVIVILIARAILTRSNRIHPYQQAKNMWNRRRRIYPYPTKK